MTVSDVIALGSLAITVLIHARAGPKPVIWLFSIVFLGALVVSVVSRVKPNNDRTPPPQSATASGGSTIVQAGGNVTIINQGVQEETVRRHLRDESVNLQDQLTHKYPDGYALFGVANGKIVYEPYVKRFRIRADWENWRMIINTEKGTISFAMPKLDIEGVVFENFTFVVPSINGATFSLPVEIMCPGGPIYAYFEVIDAKQKIFVIGFSNKLPVISPTPSQF